MDEDEDAWSAQGDERFLLNLDGFEGPLDVLLTLARDQKIDLAEISILTLADQYLAFVARVRHQHLELAAEYLVMAAWLAYLKSRLLLPEPEAEPEQELSAEEMAEVLAFRLRRLDAMRRSGQQLFAGPLLGRAVFARGEPEGVVAKTHSIYDVTLFELLKAYADHVVRTSVKSLRIELPDLYTVEEALLRLEQMLGKMPEWSVLSAYLPPLEGDRLKAKSVVAATFIAALELARQGRLILRQEAEAYSPIRLKIGGDAHDSRS